MGRIATGSLAAALLLAGCAGPLPAEQERLLRSAEDSFARQRYPEAIEQATRFLGQVRDRPEAGRARYVRAMSLAKAGRRSEAYDDIRAAISTQDDPEVVWRSYIVLGTLQFEDENWEGAARSMSAALARMPRSESADDALFRLGICYERCGRWSDARAQFEELLRRHPGSRLARDARRRVALNARFFAVQCGAFAGNQNAEALANSLARRGLDAYVRREPRDTGMLYVVMVGRYATYAEAERMLGTIRAVSPGAVLWP